MSPRINYPSNRKRTPVVQRIWAKVEQNGNGCWVFTGPLMRNGYGRISVTRGPYQQHDDSAHAAMYREVFGAIPDGMELDHVCHTRDESCAGGWTCQHRACCNPWHLEPVTTRENLLRGNGWSGRNARKTHCSQGHEFTPENTYSFSAPSRGVVRGRSCRTCHRLREARRRAARKAA